MLVLVVIMCAINQPDLCEQHTVGECSPTQHVGMPSPTWAKEGWRIVRWSCVKRG